MQPGLVVLIAVAVLLAGCVEESGSKAATGPSNTVGTLQVGDNATGDLGSIVGIVVDDEERPIARATVAIVDLSAELETAEDGRFEFKDVPLGTHTIVANRLGYDSVARKIDVQAEGQKEIVLVLPALEVIESYFESIQKKTLFHVSETYITFAVNLTGQSPMCDGCTFMVHYQATKRPDLVLWEVYGKHTVTNPTGDKEYAWAFANGANGAGGTSIGQKHALLPLRIEYAEEQVGLMKKETPYIWFQIMCETAWVCVEETRESWVTSFYGFEEFPENFTAKPE